MKKIRFKSMLLYFYSYSAVFLISIFILVYSTLRFGFQEKLIYIILAYALIGGSSLFFLFFSLYYYQWCEFVDNKFIFKCLLYKIKELDVSSIKEIEVLNLISGNSKGANILHKVICLKSEMYDNERIKYHNLRNTPYCNIAYTEDNLNLFRGIYKNSTGKDAVIIDKCSFARNRKNKQRTK